MDLEIKRRESVVGVNGLGGRDRDLARSRIEARESEGWGNDRIGR